MDHQTEYSDLDIAVVGLSCRLPGAASAAEYWDNLRQGVESIRDLSEDELREAGVPQALLDNPDYIRRAPDFPGAQWFDAGFFGLNPKEADVMDPQHRLFLECGWHALEDGGIDPHRYRGSIGVFGGSGYNAYLAHNLLTNPDLVASMGFFLLRHTGNDKDFLTTRLSYQFGLTGPSVNVQTACSTSLVAIHMACQSLLSGECDMALAGGATIELPLNHGYLYKPDEIYAADGHCRPFDDTGDGTLFGSGAGVVLLKPVNAALEDGDPIRAVIRATAINNDGAAKAGYLAPGVEGQAKVISEALKLAEVDARSIGYVEAHGTGTRVGDPIEFAALNQVYQSQTEDRQFCALGSVKGNIGHTDTAAGIAGLIKCVLAMEAKELPPTINYTRPNRQIDFEDSAFFVNDTLRPWPEDARWPRRCAVSSLGVGGTNAHVILEAAPANAVAAATAPQASAQPHILLLSARNETALQAASDNLVTYLQAHPDADLKRVAYTLQRGRHAFSHRQALLASSADAAIALLDGEPDSHKLHAVTDDVARAPVFMFTGQGSQYQDMGRGLYESEPRYREVFDQCAETLLAISGEDIRYSIGYRSGGPSGADIHATSLTQPTLFCLEYSLAQLWISRGITPTAMIGHSFGEYVAAALAGVFSLEDALQLVKERGRLMQQAPAGAMLSVMLSAREVSSYVSADVEVAAFNGPNVCVVSGDELLIDEFQDRLTRDEIGFTRLKISLAGHSKAMDGILDEFREIVGRANAQPPSRPFISNVTGTWITAEQCQDPDYWASHLRRPVQFAAGIETLLEAQPCALLEIGPGTTLTQLATLCFGKESQSLVTHSLGGHQCELSDADAFTRAQAALWLGGLNIDWDALYPQQPARLSLPGYSFTRKKHWIEPGFRLGEETPDPANLTPATNTDHAEAAAGAALAQTVRSWQAEEREGRAITPGVVVLCAPGSTDATAPSPLREALQSAGHQVVTVANSATFAAAGERDYALDPAEATHYEQLLDALGPDSSAPLHLVYCGGCAEDDPLADFQRLLALTQAVATRSTFVADLTVIAPDLWQVQASDRAVPERSLLLGPALVAPLEIPGLAVTVFDADPTGDASVIATEVGLAESEAGCLGAQLVALRDGRRFVAGYQPLAATPTTPAATSVSGTALLVGGTDGIGAALAESLADQGTTRMAFVGRTPLPPPADWERWLDGTVDDPITRRLQQLRTLEARGVQVAYAAADVADANALQAALQELRNELGPFHSAYHLAGVIDDALLLGKTATAAARVLAPKVAGTINLAAALAPDRDSLAHLVLFSSISAVQGVPGQVDYVAANAFQDRFASAHQAQTGVRTLAIAWSAWAETGIAARLASGNVPVASQLRHPLLVERLQTDGDAHAFRAELDPASHWLVNDHRLRSGEAVLPGTGFIELTRAAWIPPATTGTLQISNAMFVAPAVFSADAPRSVQVQFESGTQGHRFAVISQGPNETDWYTLFEGRIDERAAPPPASADLQRLRERCPDPVTVEDEQATHLAFGEHWQVIEAIQQGNGEALLTLQLPQELADDLIDYPAHPGLLDMATAGYLRLVPEYRNGDGFYVPVSCRALTLHRAVPARCFSHVRYLPDASLAGDLAVFDIDLYDDAGCCVASFSEYMLKRLDGHSVIASAQPQLSTKIVPLGRAPEARTGNELMRERLVETGIRSADGLAVLFSLLQQGEPSHVIVSGAPFEDTIASLQQTAAGRRESAASAAPQIDVEHAEETLLAHESVLRCAFVTKVDRFGDLRIAAFVEQDDDLATTVSELRRFARKQLPAEMVPSTIVELTEFPVDADGSVLRNALPDPFEAEETYVEANSSSERLLAEVWRDVLGIDSVSITDNFFDLGGHSLLAVRVLADVNRRSGVRLEDVLIVTSTLEQIAAELDRRLEAMPTEAANDESPKSGGLLGKLGLRGRR